MRNNLFYLKNKGDVYRSYGELKGVGKVHQQFGQMPQTAKNRRRSGNQNFKVNSGQQQLQRTRSEQRIPNKRAYCKQDNCVQEFCQSSSNQNQIEARQSQIAARQRQQQAMVESETFNEPEYCEDGPDGYQPYVHKRGYSSGSDTIRLKKKRKARSMCQSARVKRMSKGKAKLGFRNSHYSEFYNASTSSKKNGYLGSKNFKINL